MKFLMKSELTSVLAEVASSRLPEGAIDAASETLSLTVIEVATDSTDMVTGMSSVAPAVTTPPERVVKANPGAEARIEYVPSARSGALNFPSAPLFTLREAPVDSFLISNVASEIGLPV
jgi:hypothetical protein